MVFIRDLPPDRFRALPRKGGAPTLVHPTYALRPLLRRMRRLDRPQVLDLGAAEGANLEFFSQRGCRVSVEDLAEALPRDAERRPSSKVRRRNTASAPLDLLAQRRPEGEAFDAVLCWDLLDLMSADAAADLVREIRDRLHPRGVAWAFFTAGARSAVPCLRRFRILGEDSLEYRLRAERPVFRFVHQTREVIAMFGGFDVICSTFLRVGTREMLFGRSAASTA